MIYRTVIDTNVWIKYASAKDISPLLSHIIAYRLLPSTNNYLLTEVFDALVDNKWMNNKQADNAITFIRKITLCVSEKAVYGISPDPKDNYLFDLAVQNNCVFIITDDSKLLQFKLKPLPVHTTSWLLKQFPV